MALAFTTVAHVNVNCARLELSLAFYRDTLGLTPLSHTKAPPQDGAAFGLPGAVQWDAHLLHDDRGLAAQAIDLLEWQQPPPCGAPGAPQRLGFAKLLLRGGGRSGMLRDPDGVLLELEAAAAPLRFVGAALNVSRLEASLAWYERVLARSPERVAEREASGEPLGLPGRVRWREATLALTPSFALRLVEWREPAPQGSAPAAANALGLYRLALLVEDAKQACGELDALGLRHSGAAWLDMGPDIPIEGLYAGFFPDPDGSCLEWIERPRLRR